MSRKVIIDAGPLVALLHRDDQFHNWAKQEGNKLGPTFLTCESVLSEVLFLLRGLPTARQAAITLVQNGLLRVEFDFSSEVGKTVELLDRYSNVPMSFADACLVRMTEIMTDCVVFTTDGDFRIYRKNKHQVISIIIPPEI